MGWQVHSAAISAEWPREVRKHHTLPERRQLPPLAALRNKAPLQLKAAKNSLSYFHSQGQFFHPDVTLIHLMRYREKRELPEAQSFPFMADAGLAWRGWDASHRTKGHCCRRAQLPPPSEAPHCSATEDPRSLPQGTRCERPGQKVACSVAKHSTSQRHRAAHKAPAIRQLSPWPRATDEQNPHSQSKKTPFWRAPAGGAAI